MSTKTSKSDYMLLFRGPHWDKGLSPEELQQVMNQVMEWFEGLKQKVTVKAGQPLSDTGKTISGKKGRAVSDGPYPESKEAVGGYLLLEADSLDEVVAIVKQSPTLDYGVSIEIRPVLEECPVFQRAREKLAGAAA